MASDALLLKLLLSPTLTVCEVRQQLAMTRLPNKRAQRDKKKSGEPNDSVEVQKTSGKP
jgi:hypothetical protein